MPQAILYEPRLSPHAIQPLLAAAEKLRIAVIGDFCLDVYWEIEPVATRVSRETGRPVRRITSQRCAPAGAGSVALNLASLGCEVDAIGFVGDDLWGHELRWRLDAGEVTTLGLLTGPPPFATPVFVNPMHEGELQERLDLGTQNTLDDEDADRLVALLAERLPDCQAVVVSEILGPALFTTRLREGIQKLIDAHPDKLFVVDTRTQADVWRGAVLRFNAHEGAAILGANIPQQVTVPVTIAEQAARELARSSGRPVILSRGERGCLVAAGGDLSHVPAVQVLGKVDRVGAGEALTAVVALAMAAGWGPLEAVAVGNLAASIVVSKLRQSGTATPDELLDAATEVDFIYWPDLAEDTRGARFVEGTQIEVLGDCRPPARITHAIFDHDGTISTLRQGWEEIMEPMMVRAILGPRYDTADTLLFERVVERVREFIDKTTGIQTLIQMQGLVALVREYGFVPESQILDEHGYKKIYNDDLIRMVNERVERLRSGELDPCDFAMKGSIELLHALRRAGVTLYLASGTDEPDVKAEAEAMGYADLFDGHIYGSVGDVTRDAKKIVLDRILNEIGPDAMQGVVTFGDGPVEIRETRRRGGFTVGVASDEVRRFGWNMSKRTRLARAGCHWIVPDFSQIGRLLELLNVRPA